MSNSESSELSQPDLPQSDELPSEQLAFDLENTKSEVNWLRNQVEFLQQELSERVQQQQEMEQELHLFQQELVLMNQEMQQMYRAGQLTLQEAKGIVRILLQQREPPREALARFLSLIYGQTILPEELGKVQTAAYDRKVSKYRSISRLYEELHRSVKQAADQSIDPSQSSQTFQAALKPASDPVNFQALRQGTRQRRISLTQKTQQQIQQSAERIRQSKHLLADEPTPSWTGNLLKLAIRILEQRIDQTAVRQQRVEQQLEHMNTLQQKINDQKRRDAERDQPED